MLLINKLFNSIACLLSLINLQLVIPGRTWILLYLGRTVYKHLWACLAFVVFNMHYSFQHTLKCSTCCFNIVFNTYYSFQHALKFSRCFSTHLEIFNIVLNLHYSFQHSLKLSTHFFNMRYSFQNILKCST